MPQFCAFYLFVSVCKIISNLIKQKSVILNISFVICAGNSCRSPMAESVMKSILAGKNLNWYVDSAAIADWNVGYSPEPRCIEVLGENGLISSHITRQVE